jgi:hypothetical protein
MTRFRHDDFAKDLLRTILEPYGKVKIDRVVKSELRKIDVFFTPAEVVPDDPTLQLLWKCAQYGASFEPFRSPVQEEEICSTMGKLFDVHAFLTRKAKREKKPPMKVSERPQLWIITPTMSPEKLKTSNLTSKGDDWCEGIYWMNDAVCTGFIVVHKLPKTPETVWFRTLGRGKVQQEAIDEIAALPKDSVYRQKVLELFISLKVNLENSTDRDPDETELLMSLAESPVFVEYMEQATANALAQGMTTGVMTGYKSVVESMMVKRFGSLDAELNAVVPNIIKLSPSEFTPLLMDLSREELLDRFTDGTTKV